MIETRLYNYIEHMVQAAKDACSFLEGLTKDDFIQDKRTQQAVIMIYQANLIPMSSKTTRLKLVVLAPSND